MNEHERLALINVLKDALALIEHNDTNYNHRYALVLHAVSTAVVIGYQAGFRIDPKERDWPVAYIELPTGQVTWHIAPHPIEWDGHTTEEKYRRIHEYVK